MLPAKRFWIFSSILFLGAGLVSGCSGLDFFRDKAPAQAAAPSGQDPSPLDSPGNAAKAREKDAQIENLEEKIVLLEDKVNTLETQVAGQKKVIYTIEYSDPAQLYQKARTHLLAKDLNNAADLFSTFAKEHPGHGLADNALYWLGECHYTKGEYPKAIQVFKHLVKAYPKGQKVPDALLKTAYSYISLDDVNRANHFLKLVIKKYPFSSAAEKAQTKLNDF